jgi:anti-sigma regulatory factor (Ser/Thr protein kinase)
MATVELEIPPRSAYVKVVRLALSSLARSAGLDEEKAEDLKTAASEACTNAVVSNEEAGIDDPVTISWEERPDRITVEVEDRGRLYSDGPDPLDSGSVAVRMTLSVALLRSLVDECDLLPRAGGGTRARLVVSRGR